MERELYFELVGFLRMIGRGIRTPDTEQEVQELENKVGDALKEEHPHLFVLDDEEK